MTKITEAKTPNEILKDLSDLYLKKNGTYGPTYIQFGEVMSAMFPSGINITGAKEINEYALFHMLMHKITRLSNTLFYRGLRSIEASVESLDDISCYAAMLSSMLLSSKGNKEDQNE